MARRGGRRGGSRGRSSSRRSRGKSGGVGSSRSKSKSNKSKSKSKSTGGSRGRSSNTRGGQSKANRNQNKKARSTVKSVKKAVGRAAKGIGKSLRGAAANAAGNKTKPQSKLRRQLSNLKSDIAQKSTKEARFNRRADRLKKQHGLDYSRMNPSFKANVNVSQAYKHLGLDKFAPTRAVYNRLPKSIKNFSWKHQFKSPTKLGVRDGYRKPNRGGRSIPKQYKTNYKGAIVDSRWTGKTPVMRDMRYRGPESDPNNNNNMALDIDQIYKNLLGRGVKDEGKNYWTDQYNQAIAGGKSAADAISGIRGAIKQSDEYNTPFAQHRRAAMDSINRGQGVRDGTVASYSDMYTPDGTKRDDWVDEKTWLQNKVYDQHKQIQAGGGGTGGMSDDRYNQLLGNFSDLTGTLNSLKDAYSKNQKDMMAMWNNANWGAGGYGQQSQTVGGVKTQNELPGFKPKTGGSRGFFGRGNRFGLSTGALNL